MPGKKSKGNNTALKAKKKPLTGIMVKLINYSDRIYSCEWTGKLLPRNGMVVSHDEKYFVNRRAAEAYELSK